MVGSLGRSTTIGRLHRPEKQKRHMNLEMATKLVSEFGFDTELMTPPDQAHFGNWMLIALSPPLALRVTNDRGIVLDLIEADAFKAGADESDWFNWDVVARALGLQVVGLHMSGIEATDSAPQLWAFLLNKKAVVNAFSQAEWAKTRDLLHKVEAEKRREFMGGNRVPAHT
jgi:hypothetical protein